MKNIPNQITVSRIFLIFAFVVLANCNVPACHIAAYIVAIVAGLSDLADGYLARKYHWESDFGRLIDPLADKILVLATFSMMVEYGYMPAWMLIVILSREFMVTGLRTLASAKGIVIAADKWGKLKTATQMISLLVGGASWVGFLGCPDLRTPGTFHTVWMCLLGFVAFVTLASGASYFVKHKKLYLEAV